MKYIGHYDQEKNQWVPEKLPTWFVIFLTTLTITSLLVLILMPGPVM